MGRSEVGTGPPVTASDSTSDAGPSTSPSSSARRRGSVARGFTGGEPVGTRDDGRVGASTPYTERMRFSRPDTSFGLSGTGPAARPGRVDTGAGAARWTGSCARPFDADAADQGPDAVGGPDGGGS